MTDEAAFFAMVSERIDEAGGLSFFVRLCEGRLARSVKLDSLVYANYDTDERLIGVDFVAGTIEWLEDKDPARASRARLHALIDRMDDQRVAEVLHLAEFLTKDDDLAPPPALEP